MSTHTPSKLIPDGFTPIASLDWLDAVEVAAVADLDAAGESGAIGVTVAPAGDLPQLLTLDRDALTRAGFEAKLGQSLVIPQPSGPTVIAVGLGDAVTIDSLRTSAAAFARASDRHDRVALHVTETGESDPTAAAQAVTEGLLLARYRYVGRKSSTPTPPLAGASILIDGVTAEDAARGIARAEATVRAAAIARDLANTPPGHLTATNIGEVAEALGERFGFAVEVFDKTALVELGCGGLLGVNAGSTEEPRMLKLTHTGKPDAPTLALVGKGIMYDSGGISLKPSDPMHLLMKMDMGGAGAILGTFTALADLDVASTVTAWLMCTDNMPSGDAYKLGDVLTARGGKTVEVKNTDAEGRLVMMDGLVLAAETHPAAIIDIATLTGASLMALGKLTAALFGNDQAVVERIKQSSQATGEQVWQLPLERGYRKQLDSQVADISNLGGAHAGATTAALFLDEFVDGIPWAHLDIAGTMQSDADDSWRSAGATGFGARLLLDVAENFSASV